MNGADQILLVVDDSGLNRLMPGMMLRPFGYVVHESSSGSEAIEYLKNHQVAAVLLDIAMPEMNGIEVLRAIRSTESIATTKVIAYTAHENFEAISDYFEEGFDAVVIKPISFEILLKTLSKL